MALARAVYAPTKYVLLDDPLSAVDSHTAEFLVERLLRGPLLADRTVVRYPRCGFASPVVLRLIVTFRFWLHIT